MLNSRDDYFEFANRIFRPVLNYYDESTASAVFPNRYVSSYENRTADIEAFARPLWAFAGISKNGDRELTDTIFQIIKKGIDPQSKGYWGKQRPHHQLIVELPSILFFCHENKEAFSLQFTNEEKNNFENVFSSVNSVSYGENNWQFFGLLVNVMLKNMGFKCSEEVIKENWNRINACYLGNGWYSDGHTNQRDYYIAYAYHFYSLLWIYLDKNINPEIYDVIKERAELFAEQYIYFFADNGASVPYGRSLIYRFAVDSFWSAYLLAGLQDIEISVIKGIINRNLRWWMGQNIFNSDGTLNIGYTYSNQILTEYYNATGSPYWASKTFVLLLLPKDSQYWNVEESEPPEMDRKIVLQEAQFILCRDNSQTVLFPSNLNAVLEWDHATAKYEKIAYSSYFGFNVSKGHETMEGYALDSTVAISLDGVHLLEKHSTSDSFDENGLIKFNWNPIQGVNIKGVVISGCPWHVRILFISTNRELRFYDFGYAINADSLIGSKISNGYSLKDNTTGMYSEIVSLYGNGVGKSYVAAPNTNIIFPKAAVPYETWFLGRGQYVVIDAVGGGACRDFEIPSVSIQGDCFEIVSCGETYSIPKKLKSTHKPHNSYLRMIEFYKNLKNKLR